MADILLVEDERLIAKTVHETLTRMGHSVVAVATTAEEALRHAQAKKPALVLMDIHIAGALDGIRTAQLMRQNFRVPVVFLTSTADDATIERAKHVEPYGYLLKPFNERELRSVIEISLHRHGLERAVAERELWLTTTLRSLADAIITTDAAGIITFVNPTAQQLLGLADTELRGKAVSGVYKLRDEVSGEHLEAPVEEALRRRATLHSAQGALLEDGRGQQRPIEDSVAPIIDETGRVLGAVLTFRDVTERRRSEQHNATAQRLSSLSTLAAGVGHEINNPLTYILGNVEYVSQEIEGLCDTLAAQQDETDAAAAEALRALGQVLAEVREGAERIAKVTTGLKVLSRPSGKRGSTLDVSEVARGTVREIEDDLRGRARLIEELAAVPPIEAEEARLGQVLLNILINAGQAIDPGAPQRNSIRVATRAEKSWVVIEIEDSGCGMTPEVRRRVFEPFFTTRPVGTGTGLGLTVCHTLVETMGGHIDVESTVGKGSIFRVRLPVAQG